MQTIGQGGMAAVYQARDTKKGTLCAIKEMSLSTVASDERPQAIQNFLAEARILSRLNHSNLPAFTDFFTEDARHFLVMEYVDGSTLEDLLERNGRPFSERRVLGWARQLCDVLEYLHSQQPPVIFRDMKPGNVMLTRTGRIKLIDFGIARLFRSSGSQADTQLLGTPGFAPPEQYGGAQTDERSDIYSLAMTLFQLMTCSISEKGFGLTDVHKNFPYVSPPVARALEKATSLGPEDRYESIVVFRRALLGIDTFRFENGGEATTPEELAELCARYPEEAGSYLFSGEIESWLQEIGANDLARTTKRIRATVGDPEMGVNKFLQTVMGPNAHTRATSAVQAADSSSNGLGSSTLRMSIPGLRNSRIGLGRSPDTNVIVRPKTIDFGQVYPGLSAPVLLTISGARGALVSGTIHPVESWIIADATTFDGMSTPVRIRVDSTRLRGSTHYTGTIIVKSDDSEREIPVMVELDVLGYITSTTSTITSRPGQTGTSRPGLPSSQSAAALDDDEDDLAIASTSGMQMAGQNLLNSPYTNARYDEFKAKYGAPGSGGWDMLKASPRQRLWMRHGITFAASFMAGAFSYLLLAHIPPLAKVSVLAPPWFTVVLLGMLIFATLGAVIVNWGSSWTNRDLLNRVCTGLVTSLVFLGLGEIIWQNLSLAHPPLQLFVMLLLTAAGATAGTAPAVSDQIIKSCIWLMTRMAWVMYALAVVVGGSLGFALTSGFSYGCFAPFGAALGIGIGVALVLRIRRLIQQKLPSP